MQKEATTLNELMIKNLRASIQGEVILPGDADYEEARLVWNGMIDRYPALIVRCVHDDDVIAALRVAREADLLVSVRGGGHNVAGFATNDGGIVIDLSPMREVTVDPGARRAVAQGGATWADVDRATQVYGLAAPGGEVSETGIAGLTLGGGMGYLRRKYGLSCDNLVSADLISADGERLHASADENADLFWALRGGGGNFGVVTRFEYQLHPVGPEVTTGFIIYPVEEAATVFRNWREFTKTAPDELASACGFYSIPPIEDFPEELHFKPVVIIDSMCIAPLDQAEAMMKPLRELGTPLFDFTGVSNFVEAQSSFDALLPAHKLRYYWKSLSLDEVSDGVIEQLIARVQESPSKRTLVIIRHLGGAMSRVPAEATAFGDRSAQYNLSLDSTWEDPAEDEANIKWTRATWDAFQTFSNGRVYLNFPGFLEEGQTLLRGQFGKNYERLAEIKRKYDPTNFFRLNQNIKPA